MSIDKKDPSKENSEDESPSQLRKMKLALPSLRRTNRPSGRVGANPRNELFASASSWAPGCLIPKDEAHAALSRGFPTNPNPSFGQPVTSPTTDQPGVRSALPQPMRPPLPPMQGPMAAAAARQQMLQAGASGGANPTARTAPFYPTPSFQNHIEQLGKLTQQEYDAPNDMIDEVEPDTPGPALIRHTSPPTTTTAAAARHADAIGGRGAPAQQGMPQGEQQPGHSQGQGYPSMTQLLDPALDWDPFGLECFDAIPDPVFVRHEQYAIKRQEHMEEAANWPQRPRLSQESSGLRSATLLYSRELCCGQHVF
ncbi:hypothetical protein PG997_004945 [Apiospora hydei]|uniref:Uncharacterized protein n=1 Tax=Apiospora hydei TaxID=1337664 RepID=A0ABR1X3N7_9PEZI